MTAYCNYDTPQSEEIISLLIVAKMLVKLSISSQWTRKLLPRAVNKFTRSRDRKIYENQTHRHKQTCTRERKKDNKVIIVSFVFSLSRTLYIYINIYIYTFFSFNPKNKQRYV